MMSAISCEGGHPRSFDGHVCLCVVLDQSLNLRNWSKTTHKQTCPINDWGDQGQACPGSRIGGALGGGGWCGNSIGIAHGTPPGIVLRHVVLCLCRSRLAPSRRARSTRGSSAPPPGVALSGPDMGDPWAALADDLSAQAAEAAEAARARSGAGGDSGETQATGAGPGPSPPQPPRPPLAAQGPGGAFGALSVAQAVAQAGPRRTKRRSQALVQALRDAPPAREGPRAAPDPAASAEHARLARVLKRPAASLSVAAGSQPKAAGLPQVPAELCLQLLGHFVPQPALAPWPLQAAVRVAQQACLSAQSPAPTGAGADAGDRLNDWFLGVHTGRPGRVTSRASIGDALGLDPRVVAPWSMRLANCIVHLEHDGRALLEAQLTGALSADDLLFVVDFSMSDETPLPMKVEVDSASSQVRSDKAQGPGGAILQHSGVQGAALAGKKGRAISKVLQSSASFGFLVRDPRSGELVTIVGECQTWLQMLDRTTAECLLEAERRRSPLTENTALFADKLRVATLDRAGSNDRTERAWVRELGDQWSRITLSCEIHEVASAHTKVFDLTPQEITGQIHFAKSLNFGTGVLRFSRLLRSVVRERLVVLRGQPSLECRLFQRQLLRLCLARGGRLAQKRLALMTLPNGNWARHDRIEVFVPPGLAYDRERIAAVVADSLEAVLVPGAFRVYPRNRWTQVDLAFDEFCLLEGVHGLASVVYPLWAAETASAASVRRFGHEAGRAPPAEPAESGVALGDRLGGSGAREEFAVERSAPEAEAGDGIGDSARQENDHHRRQALEWLASRPLGRALLVRQCMEPLRRLVHSYLYIGSSVWETEQAAALAAALQNQAEPSDRRFVLVECAQQGLEHKFSADCSMLLQVAGLWNDLIPAADQTLAMRGLAFRMLSSAEALVYETIGMQHKTAPVKLFGMLADHRVASEVLQLKPCMLDPWAAGFVKQHAEDPDGGLLSPIALAKLRLIASLAKVDISTIEAKHAAIRRRVVARYHTHPEPLAEVSGEWVCSRRRSAVQSTSRRADGNAGDACSSGHTQSAKRSKRGGPWKAFVREQTFGTSGNAFRTKGAELAAAYRDLSAEERAKYEHRGQLARESWQHAPGGTSAFGPKTRDIQRQTAQRVKAMHVAAESQALVLPSGASLATTPFQRLESATSQALANPAATDLSKALALIRASLRQHSLSERIRAQKSQQLEVEWRERHQAKAIEKAQCVCPRLTQIGSFAVLPSLASPVLRYLPASKEAASLAKQVAEASRKSNLNKALLDDWLAKHRPIMHQEAPPIVENAHGLRAKPPCWKVGVCICDDRGKKAERFRSSFYGSLKSVGPRGSLFREQLGNKYIIVHLQGHRVAEESVWGATVVEAHGQDRRVADDKMTGYWHIAAHSFSPFQSTFRKLDFVRESQRAGIAELELKALSPRLCWFDTLLGKGLFVGPGLRSQSRR